MSIKKDKLDYIIYNYKLQKDLRKQLLVIKKSAVNYPNSGILNKALNKFDNSLENEIENKRFKKKFFIKQKPKIKEELKESHCIFISILLSVALKKSNNLSIFCVHFKQDYL